MKILVIGGYGNFGKRLVTSLLENYDHNIVVSGRSKIKGEAFMAQLPSRHQEHIEFVVLDVLSSDLCQTLIKIAPDIVVNAAGPYQVQQDSQDPYQVARACIDIGCHYVDLADDRAFVANFPKALHHDAIQRGVMLVSGASSVPGLSFAVIEEYLSEFLELQSIRYGISPGNQTERGEATVASILSYTGRPFSTLLNGENQSVYGWQNLRLYDFGSPLGKRWMGNCDIPDLSLLPVYYPSLKTVHFQAGLEISLLHVGLWCLSWFSRFRLVKSWARYSRAITGMSEWFMSWGSNAGGMYVELEGVGTNGEPTKIIWQLIAPDGVGINVPTISAELIINRISNGDLISGAMPCAGLFSLAEFFEIAKRWGVYHRRIGDQEPYL